MVSVRPQRRVKRMRLLPGAVFAICFGAISYALFSGSIVIVLFFVFCGIVVGEMVFEEDD